MIAPLAEKVDKENDFPSHLWKEMGSMGFLGVTAPEEYGGLGLKYSEHCIIMEEISRCSASIGLSYSVQSNLFHLLFLVKKLVPLPCLNQDLDLMLFL